MRLRGASTLGLAVLLATTGWALTVPAAAHVQTDSRTYAGPCIAFSIRCAFSDVHDPTGRLCPSGECSVGGVFWDDDDIAGEVHGGLDDGLDVKASIDGATDPTWGWLCVAQNTSESDPDGDVCNDPKSEPDVAFCGESPWLEDALFGPTRNDFTGEEPSHAEWVGVWVGGPVSQAWSSRSEGVDCGPLARGATTGTVTLHVRE